MLGLSLFEFENNSDWNEAGPDSVRKANHILYKYGVVDGFGHVSVRCHDNYQTFWLSRNVAPSLVAVEDIIRHDLRGEAYEGTDQKLYLERYIHAAIYKNRPDVVAIVHSHSQTIVPFGISQDHSLKAVWHMAGFLGQQVPVFDMAIHYGDCTDLLITDLKMASVMASELGLGSVILMRGHGATIVGSSLPQAVYRAIYTELNARIQLQANTLGAIKEMSAGESKASVSRISPQIKRAWDLWCEEIAS